MDTGTRRILGVLRTTGKPRHLALSPDGSTVLIANEFGSALVIR